MSIPHKTQSTVQNVAIQAVAAGPVSLISTGPLFSLLLVCLTLPTSALPQLNTHHPQSTHILNACCRHHVLKLARWLQTVWLSIFWVFLPPKYFPFLKRSIGKPKLVLVARIFMHVDAYRLTAVLVLKLSQKWSRASNFQTFSGGACPHTLL